VRGLPQRIDVQSLLIEGFLLLGTGGQLRLTFWGLMLEDLDGER